MSYLDDLKQAYDYELSQFKWDTFITLTFRYPITFSYTLTPKSATHKARKYLCQLRKQYSKDLLFAGRIFTIHHHDSNNPHCHILITSDPTYRTNSSMLHLPVRVLETQWKYGTIKVKTIEEVKDQLIWIKYILNPRNLNLFDSDKWEQTDFRHSKDLLKILHRQQGIR